MLPQQHAAVAPERGKRLDSWKEIATYLRHGVRTVQRWEREAGLPVHRLLTEKRGVVHAYTSEIDSWWQTRSSVLDRSQKEEAAAPMAHHWIGRALVISLLVAALTAAVVLVFPKPAVNNRKISGARRLTWEGNIVTPALSPDGNRIVFASPRLNADGNLDLWIRSGPEGDPKRLTDTPLHEFDAVFSPDSRRILYSVSGQKPPGMMEIEGAPPPAATSLYESGLSMPGRLLAAHAGSGRYSPDGRWIALLRSDTASGAIEFGIMPAAGGGFTAIPLRTSADDALQSCSAPVWSADGHWILLSARTLKTSRYNWWLVDVSRRAASLTPATEEMIAAGFTTAPLLAGLAPQAWLADGTVLTKGFDSRAIGIWAVGFDPRSRHIRGKPSRVQSPLTELRWFSVAGTKILFDGGDLLSGLDMVPIDLNQARQLGPVHSIRGNNPGGYGFLSLSAQGRLLAFSSRQISGAAPRAFVLDLDSGRETAIPAPAAAASMAQLYTAISADGRQVAFGLVPASGQPVRSVYVWNAGAGHSDLLTPNCGCRPISWLPDGSGLLVTLPDSHPHSIAYLDLATRQPVEILRSSNDGLNFAAVSPTGGHVLFGTANGKALVAPFRRTGQIPTGEWTAVGSVGQRILAAFWSANGARLYFAVADADGTRILTRQFDPSAGKPIGSATEVLSTSWKPVFGSGGITGIAAAGNRIVLTTVSVGSDLWGGNLDNQ